MAYVGFGRFPNRANLARPGCKHPSGPQNIASHHSPFPTIALMKRLIAKQDYCKQGPCALHVIPYCSVNPENLPQRRKILQN